MTEVFTQSSIFNIIEESECGITSCALYKGGGKCNAAYLTTDS